MFPEATAGILLVSYGFNPVVPGVGIGIDGALNFLAWLLTTINITTATAAKTSTETVTMMAVLAPGFYFFLSTHTKKRLNYLKGG